MSVQNPLVSILIDNYNYGRFLRDAVDSALNQTYGNTEVIVVDDGSTDDSRDIIASYGSRIVPVFKQNGGQASAFNAGFAVSRGDIVCFLDSDDIWLPTKVEAVVATSTVRPDAVMIYHAYRCADATLRPLGRTLPLSFLDGDVGKELIGDGGCWGFPPPSAFSFKRSVLASYMPIPEAPLRLCADACLAYLTPLLGPIAAIRQLLCLYRIHGTNAYASLGSDTRDRRAYTIRADAYRINVEVTNQILASLGRAERLRLQNHSSYLYAKYFARDGNRPSWAALSWKLACMSSEPSWFVRFKGLVKFWIQSLT